MAAVAQVVLVEVDRSARFQLTAGDVEVYTISHPIVQQYKENGALSRLVDQTPPAI